MKTPQTFIAVALFFSASIAATPVFADVSNLSIPSGCTRLESGSNRIQKYLCDAEDSETLHDDALSSDEVSAVYEGFQEGYSHTVTINFSTDSVSFSPE